MGRQVRCVYGTRDAGAIWEDCYRDCLEDMGFSNGVSSPCCFFHNERDLACVVHGDDFTCLGSDTNLNWYEAQMALSFELKIRGRLGVGCKGPNEIRILNRIVRVDDKGLYYEADPRHVDLLAESLGITIANSVCPPGVKNPDVTSEPESKSDDNDSSTMQSGDKVESAVSAHATHQSLKPSEPQQFHEIMCEITDD